MSKEMREKIDRMKNWKQFLNENVNTSILNELQTIIKNLLNIYGLRYINGVDLDKSNGHFSLPKVMTDKRGEVKFDKEKFFLYFPLKDEIINTIGKKNFDKYFTYDSSDGYLSFKIRIYKNNKNEIVSDFITSRSIELDVDDVKNFIIDLTNFINSLEKKEWKPSQKDLEQGLKDLRNI